MKHVFLLLITCITINCQGQDINDLANAYLEKAESAYNTADYESAVKFTDKAQATTSKPNTKFLYLSIKAIDSWRKNGGGSDLLDKEKKELKSFFTIANKDNFPADKYKEIVSIKVDIEDDVEKSDNTTQNIIKNMVKVEGGSFQMGGNGDEDGRPIHKVTIGSFYIGKYDVTVAEFREFIKSTGYKTDADKEGYSQAWNGTGWDKKKGSNWECDANGVKRGTNEANHPVINVSWNDAKAYCQWISTKSGKNFRLPTEAEWEYAAKGGNNQVNYIYSGSNDINAVGWYADNSGKKTHPVGQKQPNGLGLYDMTGNVEQWCNDWFSNYTKSEQNDPKGPATGESRVYRGGCWLNADDHCSNAYRDAIHPEYRLNFVGFRLAYTE